MMPPRLSSDERICFQRTLDILEATAALLSQRSGGGVNHNNNNSSQPTSPVVAAGSGGDTTSMLHQSIIATNTTVASSCQQLEDLVRLCVDLLLVDGDAKRLLVLLEDDRFLFVLRRLLTTHLKHPSSSSSAATQQQGASPSTPTSVAAAAGANSSGGSLTSPTAARGVGNGSFSSATAVSPFPVVGASFTPIAFLLFQTNLLAVVRDVFVAISASPSAVALVAPRLSQDMWLEVLMKYLATQKHQSSAECTVLEALYVLSGILQQGETSSAFAQRPTTTSGGGLLATAAPVTTTTAAKPPLRQLLLVVEEDDILVMLDRLEHGYHNVTVRNFALGTLRLWLCSRPLSSSSAPSTTQLQQQLTDPTTSTSELSSSSDYLSSQSDIAPLREAVGAVMAWILTADAAAGRVFFVVDSEATTRLAPIAPSDDNYNLPTDNNREHRDVRKNGGGPSHGSSRGRGVVEFTAQQQQQQQHRVLPQQLRFTLMTVAEILSGFVLSDSTYVPHGVLAQQRVDALLSNLILIRRSTLQHHATKLNLPRRSAATNGGGMSSEVAAIDASIETLLLCTEAISRLQDVGALMRALLDVDTPWPSSPLSSSSSGVVEAQSLQASRWLRCTIQTLLSARRLDDILAALHDSRVIDGQQTLWNVLQRSIISDANNAAANADVLNHSNQNISGQQPSTSGDGAAQAEIALSVSMIIVAASRQPTRRVMLREMCLVGQLYRHLISLVHSAFLTDGHRGEMFVLLYGPDGELLNSVQFLDQFTASGGGDTADSGVSNRHDDDVSRRRRHHNPSSSSLAGISTSKSSAISRDQQMTQSLSSWNKQPEVLLDAVKYILDPARSTPLRETLEWMSQDHNGHRPRGGGGLPQRSTSALPAALVEKRHTLATALISWAVLQTVSPS